MQGKIGQGNARQDRTHIRETRQGKEMLIKTGQRNARQDMTYMKGKTGQGNARQDRTKTQGKTGKMQGKTGQCLHIHISLASSEYK